MWRADYFRAGIVMREPFAVRIVKHMLIAGAVVLSPVYLVMVIGGRMADLADQRRNR
jgi:hypothetical protein